jgi:hypothetical protein
VESLREHARLLIEYVDTLAGNQQGAPAKQCQFYPLTRIGPTPTAPF